MSYPRDLLEQARHLARRDRRRPRQVNLRRAVSAAYYALFHLLTEAATRSICARRTESLEPVIRRTFEHRAMRRVCEQFARGTPPPHWDRATAAVPDTLRRIARTFVDMQGNRHEADYDFSQKYTRSDVDNMIQQCEQALARWQKLRRADRPVTDSFLLALLFGGRGRR